MPISPDRMDELYQKKTQRISNDQMVARAARDPASFLESVCKEEEAGGYVAEELTNMIYDLSARGSSRPGREEEGGYPAARDFEEAIDGVAEDHDPLKQDVDTYIEGVLMESDEVDQVPIEKEDCLELSGTGDGTDLRSTDIGSPAFSYVGDSSNNKPPIKSLK